jgi:hypothetical protein
VDLPNGSSQFTFRWQERDGPPVLPPALTGFGSTVLEQVMAEYADTPPRIDFAPDGVIYQVQGPLDAIAAAPVVPDAPVRQTRPNSPSPAA